MVLNATEVRVRNVTYLLNFTKAGSDGKPILSDFFTAPDGLLVLDMVHGRGFITIVGQNNPRASGWEATPGSSITIKNFPFENDASYRVHAQVVVIDYPTNMQAEDKEPYANFTFNPNNSLQPIGGQVRIVPEFPIAAVVLAASLFVVVVLGTRGLKRIKAIDLGK
jgi:hypothetical protein